MKFIREPIKSKKLWIVLGILFLLSFPWYLPAGSYEPLIYGIPYWAWIVLIVSIAISATLTFAIKNLWITDEDDSDGEENSPWNKN
ncbi:hypothetical protein KFZ58_15160 [Virgibacillus sp. NKC19-16]|uniref:hypothetical protein n=1 Tax=Virgibacillus salidurans TaxID=2831673 RepID=UPI001F363403|nr:hypothetical protein [Virgibacillus sp. NKC19-16]UJL45711.1 hypothetical protein KFZ58_15160 [Virgibacillus sp. NKC19-16]